MGQTSPRKSFLLSIHLEGWAYGFLFCMYAFTVYMKVTIIGQQNPQTQVMFVISTIMFFIATFHIAINMYRLLLAFGDYCGRSHGPEFYLGRLNRWDHVLKDGFYATQEIFGSAAAIYRTWILWNRSWRVIALPLLMLCGECITGYRTLAIFAHVDPTHNIFDPHLTAWITSFFALTVSLNIITTGLMSYIIWMTHKLSLSYQSSGSRLLQVMRIVIESASLQLIVELILLVFYCSDSNAQYVALELVTPIVAITFNAITIRLKLLAIKEEVESSGIPSVNPGHANGTVGSIPMRRIQINISQDVDIDANSNIGTIENKDSPRDSDVSRK